MVYQMHKEADYEQRQTEFPPPNYYCKSGHIAPKFWRREPGAKLQPMMFFELINSKNTAVNGIYCEPCLIIAHFLAKKQKESRRKYSSW